MVEEERALVLISRRGLWGGAAFLVTSQTMGAEVFLSPPPPASDDLELRPDPRFGAGLAHVPGRARRSSQLNASERTAIVLIGGQSNSCNYLQGGHTPTFAAKVDNLNIHDGEVYEAKDNLLGAGGNNGHCVGTRLADLMIDAAFCDRVILCTFGIGGTHSSAWAAGGHLNHRISVLAKRVAALGYTDTFTLWHQGESNNAGGGVGMEADLQSLIGTFRSNGLAGPIFISQASRNIQFEPDAGVRAAQAAVVNEAAGVYLGPDTDDILDRYDGVHLDAVGAQEFARRSFAKVQAWRSTL